MGVTVGVDPGKQGAFAALDETGGIVTIIDMPIVDGRVSNVLVARILDEMQPELVAVEYQSARPGQGVTSMFGFGTSYGIVLGAAARYPHTTITPQTWKKQFRLNGKPKDASRAEALARWPGHADWFTRKKDQGRAEAALIALAAQQHAAVPVS